ncbi:MAG: cryptochrome/photolyase family protein [Rubripirellula sp.]|nr:cryptochrome/photolyase family protein [Rubripirellula sp.]
MSAVRHLVLILGDQLSLDSAAFDEFDREQDVVWMAEVAEESTHVWTHQARITMFLAAMRHFRKSVEKKKYKLDYKYLDDGDNQGSLVEELRRSVKQHKPQRLIVVEPGEHRVRQSLIDAADELGIELEIRTDRHFLSTIEEFRQHARGRKQLRLEYFYRELRRKHDVLMQGKDPEGGKWNYDADNRGSFGKKGPKEVPQATKFKPDAITKEVIKLVRSRFANHPGTADEFDWPVTPAHARKALDDFIAHRLADFGKYQDAMWTEEPYLYHSRISAALNLKLLDPRDVVDAAVIAYREGVAPLNSVEGFIRQILGWREYVRGIYWLYMPDYVDRNALSAKAPLPDFYWNGDTDFECLRQSIGQTLQYGYAHHIQRLMVTGLFAMLLGVDPKQVHEWYLAVYIDAVEWVELPNSLGMSQFADGGVMASKPYAATGKYISRMSNYCANCRCDPAKGTGEDACPFTTLYWDFLARHEKKLAANQRMSLQVRNLERKDKQELAEIRKLAKKLKKDLASGVKGAANPATLCQKNQA